tara:strand:+ start:1626 stop:1862 length:237 start_codon:yes stop_codon:yes gene_type:complete
MPQQKKYRDIGKKQIINVVSQMIQKVEAIEMTLNLLIMFVDKEEKFNDFMTEKLGGKNDTSGNGETDKGTDTPESNED